MKTPLQELMEYMEQNQYFIGNDLLAKYKELIEKEKQEIEELEQELASESICGCGDTSGLECICNYNIEEDEDE